MVEPFEVRSARRRGLYFLMPIGELDIATAPVLEDALDDALSDETATMIVVDLTALDFMDSCGVGVLIRAAERCAGVDRLRIVNGSPAVERILDLSGMRRVLPIISRGDDPLAPLLGAP
jgi:anti-anti-sigma factor